IGYCPGDVEKFHHPAGGGRVHHDSIVGVFAVRVGTADTFLDLSGDQHIADTGGQCGGELDGTHFAQCPPGETEVVEHFEVFQQGSLRVDVQRAQFTAACAGSDTPLVVRQGLGIECLCN